MTERIEHEEREKLWGPEKAYVSSKEISEGNKRAWKRPESTVTVLGLC